MSESINDTWKKFFKSGTYEEDIVEVIKLVMRSFFEHLFQMGTLDKIPVNDSRYQAFIHARDITAVKNILYLKMDLKEIGICTPPQVVKQMKEKFGTHEYQIQINKQTEEILRLEKYKEFMDAIYIILNARNAANHNTPRNDTGWALMIASSIFNMIDLSPVKIDQDRALRLRALSVKLLEKVREIEIYDEEDEEHTEEEDYLQVQNISGDRLIQEVQNKLDKFGGELLSQMEIIENQVTSIENSVYKKPLHSGMSDKEYEKEVKEEGERIVNLSEEEWDEEFGALSEIIHEEETKIINNLSQKEFDREYGNSQAMLTVQQAERELLMLQKEIKSSFRCKNWENIAQGPFREQVLKKKINNKKDWLANEFIADRHYRYYYVMEKQLNSEIGERYFSILQRITWDDFL